MTVGSSFRAKMAGALVVWATLPKNSTFSPDLFANDIYFERAAHDLYFSLDIDVWSRPSTTSSRYLACVLFLAAALAIRSAVEGLMLAPPCRSA